MRLFEKGVCDVEELWKLVHEAMSRNPGKPIICCSFARNDRTGHVDGASEECVCGPNVLIDGLARIVMHRDLKA